MKNLIFLTMGRLSGIEGKGIYTDLLRRFRDDGYGVYIVMPHERSLGLPTELIEQNGVHVLGVRTLNLQKTSIIEKGIGQVLIESQYKCAIKKYLPNVKFDLILYSTPPITFTNTIKYLRRNNPNALSYLLLKDIFPQNAIDLGMMKKTGVKGILYQFFKNKEKKLYGLSDYIGCMSPANVQYLLDHNPDVPKDRVEVAPNSVEIKEPVSFSNYEKDSVKKRYNLPVDKPIFIYGGNLGKPQGVPFLMDCLNSNSNRYDCHFVVIGSGTELPQLKKWHKDNHPFSVTIMEGLPQKEYDELVGVCDVGLIFLDHRFTIPNFPSRLLGYLENRMPVVCATDPNTDIGRIAEENGFGYWCESNSVMAFNDILDKMIHSDRKAMGENGYDFLKKNYSIENTYNAIVSHV